MKKIIGILCAALLLGAAATGCGMAKDATSTVSQVASDAVSGAGEIVDDIGDGANSAVSSASSDLDNHMDKNDGEVSDGDGIIGNENGDVQDTTDTTDVII